MACLSFHFLLITLLLTACSQTHDKDVRIINQESMQFLKKGKEALRHHRFQLAFVLADSVEKYAVNKADVHFFRGRIYSELGSFKEAETSYRNVLNLQPDYRGVWNNLGNNVFRQQKYHQAIKYYQKELQIRRAPIPFGGMGRAYVELGKTDSARYAFLSAIKLDDKYASAYFSFALLEEDEGNFKKAIHYAEKAFSLEPKNLEYQYIYALLLVRTGKSEKAVNYLRYIVEQWPWHHSSHYNLGQALIQSGETEEAKEYLDKAEKLRAVQAKIEDLENTIRSLPNNSYSHAALAFALRRSGRYNDAMHAYKVALYLDPQNLEIRNNVANLYLINGDTTEAINQYNIILNEDSTLIDIWLNLGVVYALSAKPKNARNAWATVLKLDPDNSMALSYLSKLEKVP